MAIDEWRLLIVEVKMRHCAADGHLRNRHSSFANHQYFLRIFSE
jgi:hypothetical protein